MSGNNTLGTAAVVSILWMITVAGVVTYSVFFNILIDLALNMSLHFGVIVVLNSSWSFVTTYFYFLGWS